MKSSFEAWQVTECSLTQNVTDRNGTNANCVHSFCWNNMEGQMSAECKGELLRDKFSALTTCNHLTACSPSLSLACFQTMPTYKAIHNQAKSFIRSPTAVQSWPGSNHHAGANLWKTLRPPKNVAMVNETERESGRGKRQTNTLYIPWALSRQTSQMLNGT